MVGEHRFPFLLAYDVKLRRPGCVLLQVAMGGSRAAAMEFSSRSWLVELTPGLRLYRVDDRAMLDQLVRMAEEKR